jgi:hypothetical protein
MRVIRGKKSENLARETPASAHWDFGAAGAKLARIFPQPVS